MLIKISLLKLLVLLSFIFQSTLAQDSLRYGPEFYEDRSGDYEELVMVYIGADSCGPCHKKEVKNKIEEYKLELFKTAKKQGKSFSVIGVANDFSIPKGWEFLNSSGYYDEIIIGKNWKNIGSIQFIWNQENITAAMPTVIVFERHVQQKPTSIKFSEASVIASTIVTNFYDWDEQEMNFKPLKK